MKFSLDLQYAENDLVVIKGEGPFDTFYAPIFSSRVRAVSEHISPRTIGYDFSKIPFMNSTALGAIILAGKDLSRNRPPIKHFLINPTSPYVHNIMSQVGILGNVVPYKTIPQALEELATSAK